MLDGGVSKVLLGSSSGDSSKSVPVSFLSLVEFGVFVVLLGLSIEFSNDLSVSDNLESESVRFLLSFEHGSVVLGIGSFSFNSERNSLDRGSVGFVSVLDGVLGLSGPFLEVLKGDLGVLLMGVLDTNVLDGKFGSKGDLVGGDLDVLVVVSSQSNNNLGLLNVEGVSGLVLKVESVKLGNLDLVPVDLLVMSFLGLLELELNDSNSSLSSLGDVLDSLLVLFMELSNNFLSFLDHSGVLDLEFHDHGHNVLGGVVGFLGEADKLLSLGVGLGEFLVSNISGGLGFLLEELVVDGVLNSSLGGDDKGSVLEFKFSSLGNSDGGFLVGELDGFVCDSGVVSHLGGLVVVVKSELFSGLLGLEGSVVLLLVESSEVHGGFGCDLSLEESFLGNNGTVNGTSLVLLSLSLHVSLDLDLSSVHSLSDLASSDSVLCADDSGGSGSDVDLSLSVLFSLLVDGVLGLQFSNTLELSGVLGTVLSGNSSDLSNVGTLDLSNLAFSLLDGSGGSLGSKGSSGFGLLDGDNFLSLLVSSSLFFSKSVSMGVFGLGLSLNLEDGLNLGFLLVSDLLLEENLSLELSTDGPSLLENNLGFGRHLTLEENLSSEGSVSLGNEVRGGLSSLFLLESNLLSLFSEGRDSLLTDVVGLGRAEPVVPLHSVPESTTVFASTEVVGLVLVPVLVSKEGTVGPHPLAFLEEIVSANPDRGFGVNDRFDLVLFRSGSDGGEMSSPDSAGLLSIGPVKFGVRNVLESGLGGDSLADKLFLGVASGVFPLAGSSVHGDTILIRIVFVSSDEVSELEVLARCPGHISFLEEVVGTDPGVLVLGGFLQGGVDAVVGEGGVDGGEISSPFKAELSSVGPGSLEVVEGVLLLTVGESLGGLPGRRSGLGSNLSLADVGRRGGTVSVVPLSSGVGSVDLSTSFGFSGGSEPFPSHLGSVGPGPVVLDGFTTDPSSSDSGGTTSGVVLRYKSVGDFLLGPRVNGSEITTPRSADVSGRFPGLLISSEEEFELSVLGLESLGSLADKGLLITARVVVPSVSSEGLDQRSAHLFLVSSDDLRLSSGPVFPGETVSLSVIRPVPFSLNVECVSSHPGLVAVSNYFRDLVLFAPRLDRGKLSSEFRGTSGSSFGPSLLGGEVLVVKLSVAERLEDSRRLESLSLLASKSLLGVAESVAELDVLLLVVEGSSAIFMSEGVGHVESPGGVKNLSFVSEFLVGPDPFAVLLEVVVTNPHISSLVEFHFLVESEHLLVSSDGGEFTTSFTAVFSSGVPVKRFARDPDRTRRPGEGGVDDRLFVLALISRPVDLVVLDSEDSTSGTDGDGGGFVSLLGHVDGVPFGGLTEFSLHGVTISSGHDERSFHTDGDIGAALVRADSGPASTVNVVEDVNLTVFTADNGASVEVDSDSSSSGGSLTDPLVVDAVVDFTILSSNPDVTLGADTDISDLAEGIRLDLDPFLGVELVKVTVSGDSPRVAISSSTDSDSLDVVSNLLPVVKVNTVHSSPAVLHDLTILGSDEFLISDVGGDINGVLGGHLPVRSSNHGSVNETDLIVVLALVLHVKGTGGEDVDDGVRSADEGSLLFTVEVVPSSVLLKSKAISSSGRLVSSPVSEGEVSVVVRPSPDLVLGSLDIVVVSTNPDFVSRLDILIFPETVVLVLGEDRGKVPSLLFTVGLGIIPVQGELGGEVPDSLLAGFASLLGPCGFTVGGDDVRMSVFADSNTAGSLTVDSVPVVSSGVGSLSLNEFPDSHVFVASLVLSDDHEITGRSSSDVHGSTSELHPLLSVVSVLGGLEDSTVLADNGGLSIVLDGNSLGVARSVSVNVEFALLEEGDLSSSVDNPDLAIGTGTDINGSHGVGFPGGVLGSERFDDSRVGDGEDLTLGSDGNSLGVLAHGLGPDLAFSLVDLTVFTSDVDVLVEADGDIHSTLSGSSVLPGDVVFLLAHGSSAVSLVVVGEDLGGASVEDESHGGGGVRVGLSGETNEGLGSLVEVLVDVASFTSSVSDDDSLSSNESELETSGDLIFANLGPEVLDVSELAFGFLVDLDGLASEELLVGDGGVVDVVVKVVEHESQLGHESLSGLLGEAELDFVELGEPVGGLSLDDGVHLSGVSAGESATEVFALLAGNHAGGFTANDTLANECSLGTTFFGVHETLFACVSTSVKGGATFSLLSLGKGPVSGVRLVGPFPYSALVSGLSTDPGIFLVDTFEGHEVHDSCLLSAVTDGGEVTSPSLAGLFGFVPGLGTLVVDVVFELFFFDTGVDGPVDVVVFVDNEGSSSLADSNLLGGSAHGPELSISSELHDGVVLLGDVDGSLGTSSDIHSGLGGVSLPGGGGGGLLVDITFLVDNPDLSLGTD